MGCDQSTEEPQKQGNRPVKKPKITKNEDIDFETRYTQTNLFAAGYLPPLDGLNKWLDALIEIYEKVKDKETNYEQVVQDLIDYVDKDGITKQLMTEMLTEIPKKEQKIQTLGCLYWSINHVITRAPVYKAKNDDDTYTNLHHGTFPMSHLFGKYILVPSGANLFKRWAFNRKFNAILKKWCDFLNSPESAKVIYSEVTDKYNLGWISPSAQKLNKLDDFIAPDKNAPHWGWKSYNAYFHREIKPECRPLVDDDKPKNIITAANDGHVYEIASDIKRSDKFWLKGTLYSLENVLNFNEKMIEKFVGGDIFQSFLSGADYHRFHAPIAGKVTGVEIVTAYTFTDPTNGNNRQALEANINTRGLLYIDGDATNEDEEDIKEDNNFKVGTVCVIPIGITEISSVTWRYKDDGPKKGKPVEVGDWIEKGEEIGYFSYGGSTLALVFEPKIIKSFEWKPPIPWPKPASTNPKYQVKVNARIAVTN